MAEPIQPTDRGKLMDLITWIYILGVPCVSIYGVRLWVLDARTQGNPVSKSDFGTAMLMASLTGIIWPLALVLIGVGLLTDWWLDRA